MPSVMRNIIAILLLFFAGQSISAQQEVTLDHVTNSTNGLYLIAGRTHVFNIRYTNFPPRRCSTFGFLPNNGFVLTSPDGATWNHTTGSFTDSFLDQEWHQIFVRGFNDPVPPIVAGGDGVSPDYIVFSAVAFSSSAGMRSGYDDIALKIEIATNVTDTNLHICIDKSELGAMNTWAWAGVPVCVVVPDWGGPFCFKIIAPGCSGDVNADGQVNNDDVMFLVQFYFGLGEYPALGTGDINGDGTIDISDIVYLANFLHNGGPAPCAGAGPGGFDWKDKPDSRQAGND